jgi:hypothetical protein
VPDNDKNSVLSKPLRNRVADEMEQFTRALDAAAANPTHQALDVLREAADQLMRAVGRVLIEIGRPSDEDRS